MSASMAISRWCKGHRKLVDQPYKAQSNQTKQAFNPHYCHNYCNITVILRWLSIIFPKSVQRRTKQRKQGVQKCTVSPTSPLKVMYRIWHTALFPFYIFVIFFLCCAVTKKERFLHNLNENFREWPRELYFRLCGIMGPSGEGYLWKWLRN